MHAPGLIQKFIDKRNQPNQPKALDKSFNSLLGYSIGGQKSSNRINLVDQIRRDISSFRLSPDEMTKKMHEKGKVYGDNFAKKINSDIQKSIQSHFTTQNPEVKNITQMVGNFLEAQIKSGQRSPTEIFDLIDDKFGNRFNEIYGTKGNKPELRFILEKAITKSLGVGGKTVFESNRSELKGSKIQNRFEKSNNFVDQLFKNEKIFLKNI